MSTKNQNYSVKLNNSNRVTQTVIRMDISLFSPKQKSFIQLKLLTVAFTKGNMCLLRERVAPNVEDTNGGAFLNTYQPTAKPPNNFMHFMSNLLPLFMT